MVVSQNKCWKKIQKTEKFIEIEIVNYEQVTCRLSNKDIINNIRYSFPPSPSSLTRGVNVHLSNCLSVCEQIIIQVIDDYCSPCHNLVHKVLV